MKQTKKLFLYLSAATRPRSLVGDLCGRTACNPDSGSNGDLVQKMEQA